MTALEIHDAIQAHVFKGDYAYLREFRAGTGYSETSNRYLDAWAIQCFPSKPMLAIGIEVKVSRGDFNGELRRPTKRDSALRITNQFYFAAPLGLIRPTEIPPEAGLIEVDASGIARITLEAPHREVYGWTLPFVASLARRVQQRDRQDEAEKSRELFELGKAL